MLDKTDKVKFCCSDQAKLKARAIVFLTEILYEFYYVLYCITIPILNLFVNIYKICPSKIAYYSNQSPLFYDTNHSPKMGNRRIV